MFADQSVLAQPFIDTCIALVAVVFFTFIGHWIQSRRFDDGDLLERLAMNAVFGLIFAVGIGVTIMTRRVGIFLVQPLVLLVLACWANKRLRACIKGCIAASLSEPANAPVVEQARL